MNLKTIILACLSLLLMQACVNEPKEIFDGSTTRVEAQLKEFDKTLQDPANGWIMYYFPERSQKWGGFAVHLKFAKDGQVSIGSEALLNGDITTYTQLDQSLYALKYDMGPSLNFDTYNTKLNYYSDPDLQVGDGRGYGFGGDYEFLFKEVTKYKILLEGKKTRNRILMVPLGETTDWATYLEEIQTISQEVDIKDLDLIVNTDTITSERIANRSADFVVKGVNTRLSFAIVPTGIQLYTPLVLGGSEVSEFTYNKDKKEFVASNGVKIALKTPKGFMNYSDFIGSWTMTSYNSLTDLHETHQIYIQYREFNKTYRIIGLDQGNTPEQTLIAEYTGRGELRFVVHQAGKDENLYIWIGFVNDQLMSSFGGSFMIFAWNGISKPVTMQQKSVYPQSITGFFYGAFSTPDPQPSGLKGVWYGVLYTNITFVKN